jgi:hypothetical protein
LGTDDPARPAAIFVMNLTVHDNPLMNTFETSSAPYSFGPVRPGMGLTFCVHKIRIPFYIANGT